MSVQTQISKRVKHNACNKSDLYISNLFNIDDNEMYSYKECKWLYFNLLLLI